MECYFFYEEKNKGVYEISDEKVIGKRRYIDFLGLLVQCGQIYYLLVNVYFENLVLFLFFSKSKE